MWIIFKDSEMFSVRRWGQISMSSKRLILLSHKQTFLLIFVVRIKKSPNWQIYLFFVFFHCIFSTSDLDAWKSYLLSLLLTERIRHHLLFFSCIDLALFVCCILPDCGTFLKFTRMRGLVKDTLYTRYTRIQIQIKGLHKKGKNIKKEEISSGGNDCVKLL